MTDRLTRLWTGLLAATAALLAWHPITTPDLFFHLSLGRAVWRSASRIVPEPTAFAELAGPRVVPQWLWDVGAYGLYENFGPNALIAFDMMVAGVATWLLCRLVTDLAEGRSPAAQFLVAGLGAVAIGMRIAARPQALFMLLLPAAMLLVWRYAEAQGRRRVVLGTAWVALVVLWAQLHGSFVIAPAIGVLIVAPLRLQDRSVGQHWRLDALFLGGSALALLTSAYGPGLLPYLLSHASSDAVRHNLEMRAPSWASLTGTLLPALAWGLALFGPVRHGRIRGPELGLFALGVALAFSATRFKAAATLLSIPLALSGALFLDAALRTAAPRLRAIVAPLVSLGLVGLSFAALIQTSGPIRGPLGRGGLTEGAHPVVAWQHLRQRPAGMNVLADYAGGAALAYFADGHLRTFVDGRTPLHFDDTQFAVYRDMGAVATAMHDGLERYGIRAAVVDRNWAGCATLARRFVPVVVDARFTTFVPRGDEAPLRAIEPCGPRYLKAAVCREVADLDESLRRLAALGETSFVRFLRADRVLRCGGALEVAARLLPDARDAFAFRAARDRAEIRLLLASGDTVGAAQRLEQSVARGDHAALDVLISQAGAALDTRDAYTALQLAVTQLDDDAQPGIRTALADRCRVLGEVECVRFQALRAALQGHAPAIPLVRWAAENHPEESVRADLEGWLRVLQR